MLVRFAAQILKREHATESLGNYGKTAYVHVDQPNCQLLVYKAVCIES
jgi:hypothetical protein